MVIHFNDKVCNGIWRRSRWSISKVGYCCGIALVQYVKPAFSWGSFGWAAAPAIKTFEFLVLSCMCRCYHRNGNISISKIWFVTQQHHRWIATLRIFQHWCTPSHFVTLLVTSEGTRSKQDEERVSATFDRKTSIMLQKQQVGTHHRSWKRWL